MLEKIFGETNNSIVRGKGAMREIKLSYLVTSTGYFRKPSAGLFGLSLLYMRRYWKYP